MIRRAAALASLALALSAGVASAQTTTWRSNVIHSPSGNIRCALIPSRMVVCTTAAPFRSVEMDFGYAAYRIHPSRVYGSGPVLQYGDAWGTSYFECDSEATGMSCTSGNHGFNIAREGVETW